MNVLLVSGIWPPDVGGPASHAPELASWLLRRGHRIEAVVTADAAPAREPYPVHWVSRRLPAGVRHLAAVRLIAARARRADVVYATSMVGRTALAASLARRPYVAKIASDAAFERSRRHGLVGGAIDDFQDGSGGPLASLLRGTRDRSVRAAAAVVCPSSFMRDLIVSWGVEPGRVTVVPNPAPSPAEAAAYDGDRPRPLLAFTGRLTAQKDLGVALAALGEVPEATLVVAGDGEERPRLEAEAKRLGVGDRARFLGPRPRGEVLGLLAAADAAVLTSAWENFPHGAVEALAMGTPVIATRVGGVPEIVRDGENGLLVEPGDPAAFAAALHRYLADETLQARLRAEAAPSVERFASDRVYGELERILAEAAR